MKKPTTKQVKKLLEKNFGWENLDLQNTATALLINGLIEDTISVMVDLIEKSKVATNKDI